MLNKFLAIPFVSMVTLTSALAQHIPTPQTEDATVSIDPRVKANTVSAKLKKCRSKILDFGACLNASPEIIARPGQPAKVASGLHILEIAYGAFDTFEIISLQPGENRVIPIAEISFNDSDNTQKRLYVNFFDDQKILYFRLESREHAIENEIEYLNNASLGVKKNQCISSISAHECRKAIEYLRHMERWRTDNLKDLQLLSYDEYSSAYKTRAIPFYEETLNTWVNGHDSITNVGTTSEGVVDNIVYSLLHTTQMTKSPMYAPPGFHKVLFESPNGTRTVTPVELR